VDDDVSIRIATVEDVLRLVQDKNDRHHLREHLDHDRGVLLIALLGEALVGHLFLRLGEPEEEELRSGLPGVALIQHLKVLEAYRRRGYATRLLDEAAHRLRAADRRTMALGVDPKNEPAINLYRKRGFRTWGDGPIQVDRIDVLDDGTTLRSREDCLVFTKDVSP
jgi:ribosomal protein S18 acetylase RimI-like enzyme